MWGLRELDAMNAAEIRKRAEAVKAKLPEIDHLLPAVWRAIEDAASRGEMEITKNPLAGLRTPISDEQYVAVWALLKRKGYTVSSGGKKFLISWSKS